MTVAELIRTALGNMEQIQTMWLKIPYTVENSEQIHLEIDKVVVRSENGDKFNYKPNLGVKDCEK